VKASLSVPSFLDNFDIEANEFTNIEIEQELQQAVQLLDSVKLTSFQRYHYDVEINSRYPD